MAGLLSPLTLADARRPLVLPPQALPLTVNMVVNIWDVAHGACSTLYPTYNGVPGRIAMIDAGCRDDWHPSIHLRYAMNRTELDYFFVQNADQDHLRDLQSFPKHGIKVSVLHRSNVSSAALRLIKMTECGTVSKEFERYAAMNTLYTAPPQHPFDTSMGGITVTSYHNTFPRFADTNNLSLVLFFRFHGFKILFGGDLERDGWLALLEQPAFRAELFCTDIFVASHHGRENGFCRELFDYFSPTAVVISDKEIVHGTQKDMTATYHSIVHPRMNGVPVNGKRRFVLTTRRDGHITFIVTQRGHYYTFTEG